MKRTLLITLVTLVALPLHAQGDAGLLHVSQWSAFRLFNALAEQQEDDNLCFSPLSVQVAMSMVQNGADGNTLSQMQRAFGTEGFTTADLGSFCKTRAQRLTYRPPYDPEAYRMEGSDPQETFDALYPKCELANSLWTRPDVHLYDDFVQTLRDDYSARVEDVEFSTWEGIGRINAWADEATHGLIPRIYAEPQSDELAVVLANALYFKGAWSVPFEAGSTTEGDFWLSGDTRAKVSMMHVRDKFRCVYTPSFRTVTMDYGATGDFSMTILVPREGTTLPQLSLNEWSEAQNFAFDDFDDVIEARNDVFRPLDLYMPRFDIDGNYDLIPVLKSIGITDAFGANADFTKMCSQNRAIGRVSQMSKISVDEEGTEAAAITVIELPEAMAPEQPETYQDFKVDRPFYFTIQHRPTGTILFVGRVRKLEGPTEHGEEARDFFHPMFQDGKTWEAEWQADGLRRIVRFIIGGDTVIQDNTWKRVYRASVNYPGEVHSDTAYFAAVRETGSKVYAILAGKDEPRLLYDFDIEVGKTFICGTEYSIWEPAPGGWHFSMDDENISYIGNNRTECSPAYNYMTLLRIDTIEVAGQKLRKFIFHSSYTLKAPSRTATHPMSRHPYFVWVEGIGSEGGLFHSWRKYSLSSRLRCSIDGHTIFTDTDIMAYGTSSEVSQESDESYRPFIEDGKEWRCGYYDVWTHFPKQANGFLRCYFDGDTIVAGKQCKRLLGRWRSPDSSSEYTSWSEPIYFGALYENARRVYCFAPDSEQAELLYDFAAAEGDTLSIRGGSCVVSGRGAVISDAYKGRYTNIAYRYKFATEEHPEATEDYDFVHPITWVEGLGNIMFPPMDNVYRWGDDEGHYSLLSCTVGDELLFLVPDPIRQKDLRDFEPSGVEVPTGVKKQWLDFTHTTKPRPKAPLREASEETSAETDSLTMLTGQYSEQELYVNLASLQGPYTVTITAADGDAVYVHTVQTSSVVAINTALTSYPAGTYTVSVENDDETYTATLVKGLDVAVRDIPAASVGSNSGAVRLFDLSGRRLSRRPTRGLYIEDGRLRVAAAGM